MKRSIDDIVSPENRDHRSIRKVNVDRTSRRKKLGRVRETEHNANTNLPPKPPRTRRTSSRWGFFVIIIVSILILIFSFSFLFSGAKLIITPKQRTVLVDSEFKTYKEPKINELGYEIMTIERDGSQKVTASGEEFVKEKASGKIIIYNNFNSSNQRLIKNTRFETPDGLIYRINKSIVIPGRKKENGTIIPGSIEVTVYADEEGEKYNIGLTDFTIPGFKGSARFNGFYARSKTEMTEGFVGKKKTIKKEDEVQARSDIQKRLKTQLLKEVFSQKPKGFEIYEDGIFINFKSLPDEESNGQVNIKEKAMLYGVLFKQEAFAKFIARNTIAGFEGEKVEVTDPSTLKFNILEKNKIEPWISEEFSFKLSGKAHIVWNFESNQLKEDLAGKSKGALKTVLTGYPNIDEARIVLRPFWRQTFPDKIEDIKIITIIEK